LRTRRRGSKLAAGRAHECMLMFVMIKFLPLRDSAQWILLENILLLFRIAVKFRAERIDNRIYVIRQAPKRQANIFNFVAQAGRDQRELSAKLAPWVPEPRNLHKARSMCLLGMRFYIPQLDIRACLSASLTLCSETPVRFSQELVDSLQASTEVLSLSSAQPHSLYLQPMGF